MARDVTTECQRLGARSSPVQSCDASAMRVRARARARGMRADRCSAGQIGAISQEPEPEISMVDQPLSRGHDIIVAGQDAPAPAGPVDGRPAIRPRLPGDHRRRPARVTPLIPSIEPRPGARARLYDAEGRDREVKLAPAMASRVGARQLLWIDVQGRERGDLDAVGSAVGLEARSLERAGRPARASRPDPLSRAHPPGPPGHRAAHGRWRAGRSATGPAPGRHRGRQGTGS